MSWSPKSPKSPNNWSRLLGWWCFGILILLSFLHASGPVTTNDLFWHIKTGEHLWQVGHWPVSDVFSYTTAGLEWVLHEWLTQLCFFALHSLGGLQLLRLFTGVMAILLLWLCWRSCRSYLTNPLHSAAVVAVFALLGTCRMQTRPTLFSMAMWLLAIHWALHHRGRFTARHALAAAGLVLLWVNLHSVGLLGVVIYASYCLGRLGQHLIQSKLAPSRADAAWLGFGLVATVTASLLNPHGMELYSFAFQDKSVVMNFITDEWGVFRLSWRDNLDLPFSTYVVVMAILGLVLLTYLLTGAALSPRQDKRHSPLLPDPLELSILLLCLGGAIMARRFLWLLAPCLLLCLVQLRRLHHHSALPRWTGTARLTGIAATLALLSCTVILYRGEWRFQHRPLHANLLDTAYYTDAIAPALDLPMVRFLAAAGLRGNAFCHYASGGMLSWFLHPQIKVFIDSRVDLYRREVFLDFLAVRDGHPDQQRLLDHYQTDIYCQHWDIAPLRDASKWSRVYRGSDGAVWLRRTPSNLDNLARCKQWHAAHHAAPVAPR